MPKVSIKPAARAALKEGREFAGSDTAKQQATRWARTADSLQNFAANLGVGTNNLSSATGYGFNPITRIRILLEWIHRGTWLGGVAVNIVAEDMTRAGVDFLGKITPEDTEKLERAAVSLGLWQNICNTIKWSRLYGGCIAVMLIDGQDISSPLRLEAVGKGQFKGLLVLDRWQVDPSLSDLVTEFGPQLGQPKYYSILVNAPALRGKRVHYSRVLRLEGYELPYQQKLMENLWGVSVFEPLYDRFLGFDTATTAVAQLIFRAYLRVVKIKGQREIIAAGGTMEANLIAYVDFMRRYQSLEGITMLDAEDDAVAMTPPSFSGLREAVMVLGEQLSGALQIPLTRMFGQAPAGLNATGESDLRTYYDGIRQKQDQQLKVPLTLMYRAAAQSEGVRLDESFGINFRSLWVLSDQDKAGIASTDSATVVGAYNAGVISPQTALRELRQLSRVSGRFTNISDAEIDSAPVDTGAQMQQVQTEQMIEQGGEQHELALAQGEKELEEPAAKPKPKGKAA
jgi:phage-related protein (TIGR01555 family)